MIIIAGLVILIAAVVAEVAGVEFIDCRGLRALAGAAAPSAPGALSTKYARTASGVVSAKGKLRAKLAAGSGPRLAAGAGGHAHVQRGSEYP